MSREKQIKEMSKVMHDGCCIVTATNQCHGDDCLDCGAETLYEKGYRKASDVAEEIFAEIEKVAEVGRIMNACAIISLDELAELKKKYTEEGE